jgi:hypothetical protein
MYCFAHVRELRFEAARVMSDNLTRLDHVNQLTGSEPLIEGIRR